MVWELIIYRIFAIAGFFFISVLIVFAQVLLIVFYICDRGLYCYFRLIIIIIFAFYLKKDTNNKGFGTYKKHFAAGDNLEKYIK